MNLDGSRVSQLFQDKRFVTFLTGGGVCLILIIYYFLHHTKTPTEAVSSTTTLNANMPNAGDSTGLPSRSKLELAADGQGRSLSMPDQLANERGLNSNVPVMGQADRPGHKDAQSYIYGPAVPETIYQETSQDQEPTMPKSRTRRSTAVPLADEYDDDDEPVANVAKTNADLEKQKKLLALLQEYKADKIKRQQELVGRSLKPETVADYSVSSLSGPAGKNSFYGLQSEMRRQQMDSREDSMSVTIKAVVFSDQTIITGGRVGLRLLEPITLRGRSIPEGTRLYGVANFSGQRVNISITSVQTDGRIFPIRLVAYDMDGLSGIYVPNVLSVEQGRQTMAQAAQGLNINTPVYSNNVPGVAAASALQAGIQGGRTFLSRKVSVQKATLKNNYYVLLK